MNKLTVVHFKGSAQLTQFSLAEHTVPNRILVRYIEAILSFKF